MKRFLLIVCVILSIVGGHGRGGGGQTDTAS